MNIKEIEKLLGRIQHRNPLPWKAERRGDYVFVASPREGREPVIVAHIPGPNQEENLAVARLIAEAVNSLSQQPISG